MNSYHPRTYLLFRQLAFVNRIKMQLFDIDHTLEHLCIRLRIQFNSSGKISFSTFISNKLNDKSRNIIRLYKCMSFWLPYAIEISKRKGFSFELYLNASDWSIDNFLSMTSENLQTIIPDEYSMIASNRKELFRIPTDFKSFKSQWLDRKSIMYWRGSTTGNHINKLSDLENLERVKICNRFKELDGFDIKLTNIVQNNISKIHIKKWLLKQNIIDHRIKEKKFNEYKFYPDFPGNNKDCSSWGLIRKFMNGNLIFKMEHISKLSYDQYLIPWKHYVPLENNSHDLEKKFIWANENLNDCLQISWNGLCEIRKYLYNIKEEFIIVAQENLILISD